MPVSGLAPSKGCICSIISDPMLMMAARSLVLQLLGV
jgi:hypothetical protein